VPLLVPVIFVVVGVLDHLAIATTMEDIVCLFVLLGLLLAVELGTLITCEGAESGQGNGRERVAMNFNALLLGLVAIVNLFTAG
jgi:hypothetical protein